MSLQDEVLKLRKLAIDAFMASQPGYLDVRKVTASALDYSGTEVTSKSRSVRGYFLQGNHETGLNMVIQLPAADGTGGGRVLMYTDPTNGYWVDMPPFSDYYVQKFAEIRNFVENQFKDFHEIPREYDFAYEIDCIRQSISTLAMDFHEMSTWGARNGSEEGYSRQAADLPSEVMSHLDVIFANLMSPECFSGSAILPLKARYVSGTQTASRALYGLLYVYGGHIAAQQRLWKNTKADIHNIALAAQEGCQSVVAHNTFEFSWEHFLNVVGVVLEGASILADMTGVGKVAKGVIDLVGLGVKTAGDAVSQDVCVPEATDPNGAGSIVDYDSLVSFITTSVSNLRNAIHAEESLIRSNVNQNLSSIDTYKDQYDLQGAIFDTTDRGAGGGHNTITWLPSASAEVATSMRAAAGYFQKAGSKLDGTELEAATKRPYGLGIAATGPAREMGELGATLRALLIALGAELEAGADNLDATTDMIMRAEEGHRGTISVLQSEIDLESVAHLDSGDAEMDPLGRNKPAPEPLDMDRLMSGLTPSDSQMWQR